MSFHKRSEHSAGSTDVETSAVPSLETLSYMKDARWIAGVYHTDPVCRDIDQFLGTAFFVDAATLFSAYHVIHDRHGVPFDVENLSLKIRNRAGEVLHTLPVRDVEIPNRGDVSILTVSPFPDRLTIPPILTNLSPALFSASRPIHVVGFPAENRGETGELFEAVEVRVLSKSFDTKRHITALQITGGVNGGMSGGPCLINYRGKWYVFGMTYLGGMSRPAARVLSISHPLERLDSEVVSYNTIASEDVVSYRQNIIDHASTAYRCIASVDTADTPTDQDDQTRRALLQAGLAGENICLDVHTTERGGNLDVECPEGAATSLIQDIVPEDIIKHLYTVLEYKEFVTNAKMYGPRKLETSFAKVPLLALDQALTWYWSKYLREPMPDGLSERRDISTLFASTPEHTASRAASGAAAAPSETATSAPPPTRGIAVAKTIMSQIIGVSLSRVKRNREALVYNPVPFEWQKSSASPVAVPVENWRAIEGYNQRVRKIVDFLIGQALVGAPRNDFGIEPEADDIARHILPPEGLRSLLQPGTHPKFDTAYDIAAQIPWEMLEERYLTCNRCGLELRQLGEATEHRFCSRCGAEMTLFVSKLSLAHHVSHLVRGSEGADCNGRTFVLTIDPLGALFGADKARSRRHHDELAALLETVGFQVTSLIGRDATISAFSNALKREDVQGLYFLGYGYYPRRGDQGCLVLSDGTLTARNIEELRPLSKFVFLNSCYGADHGRDWDLENHSDSAASAFAQGNSRKTVIAPMWPLVPEQAERAAREFFKTAIAREPLGEAMNQVRTVSYELYKNGWPDLNWMAYRFFGNPDATIPVPREEPSTSHIVEVEGLGKVERRSRLFDEADMLNIDIFSCGIEDILLRAVKRRNLTSRAHISVLDLVTGLIRCGNLMRFFLRSLRISPDELYKALIERHQTEAEKQSEKYPSPRNGEGDMAESEEEAQRIERWIVNEKRLFEPLVVELFASAEVLAVARATKNAPKISERVLLEVLLKNANWETFVPFGLPEAPALHRLLEERVPVDENGNINLRSLSPEAKKVVDTAHHLAQQRGIIPISNRLLLAAFIKNRDSYTARVFEQHAIDPELYFQFMLAFSESGSPTSYGLGVDACQHILLPVLVEAKGIAEDPSNVTEKELFVSFCTKANRDFKMMLRALPQNLDLDRLQNYCSSDPDGAGDPEASASLSEIPFINVDKQRFTAEGWHVLQTAAKISRSQGWAEIRSPHLYAALLETETEYALQMEKEYGGATRQLQALVLSVVPLSNSADTTASASLSSSSSRVCDRAGAAARKANRTAIAPKDLIRAFFSGDGGIVVEVLKTIRPR